MPNNMRVIYSGHSETNSISHYATLRKEGNVLFNDALNTFYLRLHGVGGHGVW